MNEKRNSKVFIGMMNDQRQHKQAWFSIKSVLSTLVLPSDYNRPEGAGS